MLSASLRQLEYAVAVARHGGMTAAAEALRVSQPALSVAVAHLEAQLGQPLFLRRAGGRIMPSQFGRGWLDEADRQLVALGRLMAGAVAGAAPLRLAVFEDLAPALLGPLMARLVQTMPALAVTPQVMGFEPLATALARGQIDVALTWDLGLDQSILRHEMIRIAPHAVLAADHPLTDRPSLELTDLAGQPLILADQGLSLAHFRALFSRAGVPFEVAHRTATLDLMRSFAANGLGIGLSYSRPAALVSHDGLPLKMLPLRNCGDEPVVLAHLNGNLPPVAILALLRDLPGLRPLK